MASFRKRGKGKYELTVELGYLPSGSRDRRYKNVDARNDSEAKKQLAMFESELIQDSQPINEKIRFDAFVKRWKEEFGSVDLDPNTYETYCYEIDNSIMPFFKASQLGKIRTYDIKKYFNEETRKGIGQYGLEKRHRAIRSLFGCAKDWNLIKTDPSRAVRKPKIKRREKEVYDEEEINKLLHAIEGIPTHHRLMIKLALVGGLRRGEVLGIDLDKDIKFIKKAAADSEKDIEFENGTIHICHSLQRTKTAGVRLKGVKNDQERSVTFPGEIMKELWNYRKERWKERDGIGDKWVGYEDEEGKGYFLLFGHENGEPYSPHTLSQMWSRLVDRLGIKKISFHDLRHSSATYLLSNGINMKVIQKRLGHKDITTTMNLYAHVLKKDAEEPAEVFGDILEKKKKTP